MEATHYGGIYYNNQRLTNYTYNVAPGGNPTLGRLTSFYDGRHHTNAGARAREEIKFAPGWTAVVAAAVERTEISALNTNLSFPGGGTVATLIPVQREYLNRAREGALLYQPNTAWQFRARVAEGYGHAAD